MRGQEEPLSGDRAEQRVQGLLPVVSIKELISRARTATGQPPRSNRIMHQFWFGFKKARSHPGQKMGDDILIRLRSWNSEMRKVRHSREGGNDGLAASRACSTRCYSFERTFVSGVFEVINAWIQRTQERE